MIVSPVNDAPALMVRTGGERALVITDLHLGAEGELASRGVSLPSQIPRVKEKIVGLIEKKKPKRLIMLGDVKHNVPFTSWQEWRELPKFFADLSKIVRVEIVRGNHDGDLEGLVPEGVVIHGVKGMILGKKKRIGLVHGHAWPAPELFDTEVLVAGHNHPAIEFRDRLGGRIIEPVWVNADLKKPKLPKKIQAAMKGDPPKLIVVPAFGVLVGGASVNRRMPQELIGPLFKSGAVDLKNAQVYLLDGTFLGRVSDLKKIVR